jgi:hypothetical protein
MSVRNASQGVTLYDWLGYKQFWNVQHHDAWELSDVLHHHSRNVHSGREQCEEQIMVRDIWQLLVSHSRLFAQRQERNHLLVMVSWSNVDIAPSWFTMSPKSVKRVSRTRSMSQNSKREQKETPFYLWNKCWWMSLPLNFQHKIMRRPKTEDMSLDQSNKVSGCVSFAKVCKVNRPFTTQFSTLTFEFSKSNILPETSKASLH